MHELQRPSHEHAEFDQMCAGLEEWDPLPEPDARTLGQVGWLDAEGADDTPFDDQILAGLISPL